MGGLLTSIGVLALSAILFLAGVAVARPAPPPPMTAAEILRASDQAMGSVPVIRVEKVEWPYRGAPEEHRVSILEYAGTRERLMRNRDYDAPTCPSVVRKAPPFASRSLGALAFYPDSPNQGLSASAPALFELLGDEKLDGEPAWVVRYAYTWPSIDSQIRVENTEWIAKQDFRLLRQEQEYVDGMGFIGQFVSVFRVLDEAEDECPAEPEHTVDELRPRTEPRISVR